MPAHKRQRREEDSESEPEDGTHSTESVYRAIDILLCDARGGRPTKHKTLSTKMGKKWSSAQRDMNDVLKSNLGLQVKEVPRLAEGPARGEVYVTSTLPLEYQKVVNKYSQKRNRQMRAKQRIIILYIVTSRDEGHEGKLVERLLELELFNDEDAAANFLRKMQSSRLLECKKMNTGANTTNIYSVGPLASMIMDKGVVVENLKSIVGYNDDNQIDELKERNEEHINELVNNCFT